MPDPISSTASGPGCRTASRSVSGAPSPWWSTVRKSAGIASEPLPPLLGCLSRRVVAEFSSDAYPSGPRATVAIIIGLTSAAHQVRLGDGTTMLGTLGTSSVITTGRVWRMTRCWSRCCVSPMQWLCRSRTWRLLRMVAVPVAIPEPDRAPLSAFLSGGVNGHPNKDAGAFSLFNG